MKNEAPRPHQLNEQTIREAAGEAVIALELDAEVKSVSAEKGRWCVSFTADYGQFSDTFVDRFGKENSFELIREKVKRHILKQQQHKIRSGLRIRRGQQQSRPAGNTLFETAVQTLETVAAQAANLTGEIINQAASLPAQALTALTETGANINATTEPPSSNAQPDRSAPTTRPLARVTLKAAASSGGGGRKSKPTRSGAKRKASSKTRTTPAKKSRAMSAAKKSRVGSKVKPKTTTKKVKPKAASKKVEPTTPSKKVKPKAATKKKAARKSAARTTKKRGVTKRSAKGKK